MQEKKLIKPIEVELKEGETYYWCRCGKSENQPFCDGSHKNTEFTPLEYISARTAKVWLCVCKKTKASPFCDWSHNL